MASTEAPFPFHQAEETPLVILCEGSFGESQSKLALGVIRYGQWPIAAVVDSTHAGKTVRQVTGLPCDAPIVAHLEAALTYQPKALLIGTAPPGGQLPPEWRAILKQAIEHGLHLINGLHFFLSEEPELVSLAQQRQVSLWDVRDPAAYGPNRFQSINLQKPRPEHLKVVAMVGSDCSVGKMHTALELYAATQALGESSAFVATGQTGILISGKGVPLDRVIGDFMAGGIETCIQECVQEKATAQAQQEPGRTHYVFVEGQGSLIHPAYSGVTLSLLHGANPDALILCHKAALETVRNYPQIPMPGMKELIALYEMAASWVRPIGQPKARVAGISVNTADLTEEDAERYLLQMRLETGLPATDPVRYGVQSLLEALAIAPVQITTPQI
ncbi:DUF1611 domain-containing protein [Vampirovibrio sp.]|uniref:DUF1611 domain-containing protein n=1 Tax=Vampirovibrio sp. TaxID=2717857 RepID=UPI003593C845